MSLLEFPNLERLSLVNDTLCEYSKINQRNNTQLTSYKHEKLKFLRLCPASEFIQIVADYYVDNQLENNYLCDILPNLEVLCLNRGINSFSKLNSHLKNFKKLKILDLRGNSFSREILNFELFFPSILVDFDTDTRTFSNNSTVIQENYFIEDSEGLYRLDPSFINEFTNINQHIYPTGISPLHLATSYSDYQLMQTLLKHKGANPNIKIGIDFDHRIWEVSRPFIFPYSRDFFKISSKDSTPMHICAIKNDTKSLAILVENGASIDPLDTQSRTPFHFAALK